MLFIIHFLNFCQKMISHSTLYIQCYRIILYYTYFMAQVSYSYLKKHFLFNKDLNSEP